MNNKKDSFIGWTTVSSKGQVSIPAFIRKQLNIKKGDRILMVSRKNNDGVNIIKENAVNKVFKKFSD